MVELPQSERDVRIRKVERIKSLGIIPYAQHFSKENMVADIISTYEDKDLRDINDVLLAPVSQVKTAGRLMLYRSHGKLAFARLLDSTEQIQLMFHRDNCKIVSPNGEVVSLPTPE
jgi:lysyl-tRNA synthetase class 2